MFLFSCIVVCLKVLALCVYVNVDAYWNTPSFSSQYLLWCMMCIWNEKYCFFCECRLISCRSFELKEKMVHYISWKQFKFFEVGGHTWHNDFCVVVLLYVVNSSLQNQGCKVFHSDLDEVTDFLSSPCAYKHAAIVLQEEAVAASIVLPNSWWVWSTSSLEVPVVFQFSSKFKHELLLLFQSPLCPTASELFLCFRHRIEQWLLLVPSQMAEGMLKCLKIHVELQTAS